MELSGLLSYCILFYYIIHAVLCQNTDESNQFACHEVQDKKIGHVKPNQIIICSVQHNEIFHIIEKMIMKMDWMCLNELLLILDEDLEQACDHPNAFYGIIIEHLVVRQHMVIAKSYRKVINQTIGFMVYESMQGDKSFFVVLADVLNSNETTWYLATLQITRCMYLSKLQQFHRLKEIFDVKFKPLRLTCLQKDPDKLKIIIKDIHFLTLESYIGFTTIIAMCNGSNNVIFSKLTFDHFCYLWTMNGPSNGAMANVFTSDYTQSTENIKGILNTSIALYSLIFYQWEQNNLVRCGGIIIPSDTELLHYTADEKPSTNLLLCFLQSITITAGNASHLMNILIEQYDRVPLDEHAVEHDSYQDMHFWHLVLACISLNGTEKFLISHAWGVNGTTDIMNQNLITCRKYSLFNKRLDLFLDYTRRHNIPSGYQIDCSFFKRKCFKVNCIDNYTDFLNQFNLAYKSSFEMCVLNKFSVYFESVPNRRTEYFSCTLNQTLTPASIKRLNDRKMKQPSHIDHGKTNASKRSLLCLHIVHYPLNIITNVFLLSFFFIALLFPLITFLSRLFFRWCQNFSHFLVLLSDKLNQTLWPWTIIRFLCIYLIKLLLASYFEGGFISHFYEIKACTKTIPYANQKSESSFSRHYDPVIRPDLAKKIFNAILCCFKCVFIEHDYKQLLQNLCTILSRLLLPGKLISDVPEETEAIKCTDDGQCNAIRVLNLNMPPTYYSELATENTEAIRLEINKLKDTIKHRYYNTDGENSEEATLEIVPSRASDDPYINSSDAELLLIPSQSTFSDNVHLSAKVPTLNSNDIEFHENFWSNQSQLTQSNKQKHGYSSPDHTAKQPLICRILEINLELFIVVAILTALCFGIYKSNRDTTEESRCKCDLRSQDFKWKDANKHLLFIKYSLLNYEPSKIFNYQRIRSDFQFLNFSKVFLDYVLHDLLGHTLFVVCVFQLIMEMFCDISQQCNHSKCQKSLLSIFQTILRDNYYSEKNNIKTSIECIGSHICSQTSHISIVRSTGKKKVNQELNSKLYGFNQSQIEASVPLGSSDQPKAKSIAEGSAYLPTTTAGLKVESKTVDTKTYSTDKLPGATASHDLHYETDFGEGIPISREETRKNVRPVPKEKDVDSLIQSYQKNQITATATGNISPQDKVNPPAQTVPSSSVSKSHKSLPRRACLVHHKEQYHLDKNLLSQPRATKYLVKVRTEISPGRYMAKLELQCSSNDDKNDSRLPNLDATQQAAVTEIDEQTEVPTRERRHFLANINKIGHVIFSSNLECFSGNIQYPLPNKKAVASRIGYGGNAIVFVVFYAGKEFAVKKTVYRSKEISVHSQLCHPNIINLEAVLIGEKHERHKDKHYVYCFMPKMDINFRNVLSTKEHGCLKHMKMQLLEKREQWEQVLVNVKHVLKSVLKALDYMHSQGLVHRDIKASNILIKMTCQCTDVLYCNCQRRKFLVQIGDFDSSATVPGYQLQLEENQMIRYASVLPLGTMGYRAPEVSMHLVLSGPYEVLYTTSVDIWSFGCLLLTIFIGKSGPLKQRGEASLLLSAQDHPYSQDLYHKIIKIKEVRKYYANTAGVCDLVQKCLQVQPHCRPTAKELLQLDFFTDTT